MKTKLDPQGRFVREKGPGRTYFDALTGRHGVSRRKRDETLLGMSLEEAAARRAASQPTPMLDRLRDRLQSMTRRGFTADEIAHRTRTAEPARGRVGKVVGRTHELASAGTIRDVAGGKGAVTERRAGQILDKLDHPEISYTGQIIGRDGSLVPLNLVGEDSARKFHNYYDAIVKLSKGDSSKFDSLSRSDLEVRIVGPSGRVENYRLNDDKAQIKRELDKGRLEEYGLPSRETKRGKSP